MDLQTLMEKLRGRSRLVTYKWRSGLEDILVGDGFRMFAANRPSVLEAVGTTADRLRTLEIALR